MKVATQIKSRGSQHCSRLYAVFKLNPGFWSPSILFLRHMVFFQTDSRILTDLTGKDSFVRISSLTI